MSVHIGFDPGGINSFGWAALDMAANGAILSVKTGVVSSAPDAVREASRGLMVAPAAVGIDAPLFWVESGDRRADAAIRRRVVEAGGQSGTVSTRTSLPADRIIHHLVRRHPLHRSAGRALLSGPPHGMPREMQKSQASLSCSSSFHGQFSLLQRNGRGHHPRS